MEKVKRNQDTNVKSNIINEILRPSPTILLNKLLKGESRNTDKMERSVNREMSKRIHL